ncbi:MAG: hypothetical protein HKN16_10750, partial [Saprospiraceae bacterium]|nr:hypothetical protein [Saprospiraceae bacterium]
MKTPFTIIALFFSGLISLSLSAQTNCNPNCTADTVLNFSTGLDPSTGGLINVGQTDPLWSLVNVAPINQAWPGWAVNANPPDVYAIQPLYNIWNVLPGSRTLSFTNITSFGPNNFNSNQPWRFRRDFCICDTSEVTISGRIKADDTGGLYLYEANGTPVSTLVPIVNPVPSPGTQIFNQGVPFNQVLTLPPGKYFLEFELLNTNGSATGFAVSGQITQNDGVPTVDDEDPLCCATSVISGQKILDANCNLTFDAGDQTGAGWTFELIDNATGLPVATTTSNVFGEFFFNNLASGNYTVREVPQWGWFGLPTSQVVSLGVNDVQFVQFFNCEYQPNVWSGCVYGDTIQPTQNSYQERGQSILFATDDTVATLFSTNISSPDNSNHRIGRTTWDGTGVLSGTQRLNRFEEIGGHVVQNVYSGHTNNPLCSPSGEYVVMGTMSNAGNQDVFFSEMNSNGDLVGFADVTNTDFQDEVINEMIIDWPMSRVVWVGTHKTATTERPAVYRIISCNYDIQNEYLLIGSSGAMDFGSGQSIVQLIPALPAWPDAVYAMTGSIGHESYIILLDDNLNIVSTFKFDVDNDPTTSETGIRIRQDGSQLVVVGNSVKLSTGPPFPNKYRVFMQKFDFPPGTQLVRTANNIYDISGGGESVVDMEINGYSEIILTGKSAIDEATFVPIFAPNYERTFTMALDEFGNVLWTRQANIQEGSAPKDLYIGFNDEVIVTGSCWINYDDPGDPIINNVQLYDQWILKADRYGRLDYQNICQDDLATTVTSPQELWTDFIADPQVIPDNGTSYDYGSRDYFPEAEYCYNGGGSGGNLDCMDVDLISAVWNNPNQDCCYELDYVNNSPVPLAELCFDLSPGTVIFDQVTLDPAFNISGSTTGNRFCVKSAIGVNLPSGTVADAIRFCFVNSGTAPPVVTYEWRDAFGNILCDDVEEFVCDTGTDQPCVDIINDTIYCHPVFDDFYVFEFDVKNLSVDPVQEVNLYGLTSGFAFSGFINPINLSPPLNNFCDVSGRYTALIGNFTGSPITVPTDVCFFASGKDSTGCCNDVEQICVTLPPCCDPCENAGVMVNTTVTFPEECCYSLDVYNNCPDDQLSYIETKVLTPGVVFGSHNLGIGYGYTSYWDNIFVNDRCLEWKPQSGNTFPMGNFPELINFCLD